MLNIRKANIEDVKLVLQFIKELADFEKLLHTVTATTELLKETIFGKDSNVEVAIAELDNQAVGFVLYFFNFSTFVGKKGLYIEDLYVKPEFRGKGIGKSLLKYTAEIAIQRNCGRMEWSVLTWNPAVDFYKSIGAEIMDEWRICRLDENKIEILSKM